MRKMNHCVASVIIGLSLSVQTGCGTSKPSRYYLLSALSPSENARAEPGMAVGIGPIEFPKYLDRPQIVTRGNGNRIYLGEFDRWAEPLEQSFARVLTENLAALLPTDDVFQYPWMRSARIDYQIMVTVNRFDTAAGGETVLHTRWTIRDADGRTIAEPRASRSSEPTGSTDYEAIVRAQSRVLQQLSRRIAGALQAIEPTPKPKGGD